MGIVFQNFSDGSMGMVGRDAGKGDYLFVNGEWIATSVDKRIGRMSRQMVVQSINAVVTVAGTDGGAVTAVIRKVPSGTAITAGTLLHTGNINLKGTAETDQALTLSTTENDLILAAGDAIAIDFTGVLTAATGIVTVGLSPR